MSNEMCSVGEQFKCDHCGKMIVCAGRFTEGDATVVTDNANVKMAVHFRVYSKKRFELEERKVQAYAKDTNFIQEHKRLEMELANIQAHLKGIIAEHTVVMREITSVSQAIKEEIIVVWQKFKRRA